MLTINYDGKNYQLLRDAYMDNDEHGEAAYYAPAISSDDNIDDDGWQSCYEVKWEIIPEYADDDDASNHCDWENPVAVVDKGYEYNASQDRVV